MTDPKQKLKVVGDALFAYVKAGSFENDAKNIGLYVGQSGILLFLANYLKDSPDKVFEQVYEIYLEGFLENLTSKPQATLTYCSGLAGALACLKMMNRGYLIELDFSEIEYTYNPSLWHWMNYWFASRNYDFMHGALGIAMYFRNKPEYIKAALVGLDRSCIKDGNRLKWISSLGIDRPQGYNICLSHGISSIIVYLSQVYKSGIETELNKTLLTGAVNYVLSQEIDHKQHGSYFPSQSLENGEPPHKSRLAWCYGDLGVAAALWQAGKAGGEAVWCDKATEVYKFSALRRDYLDIMVNDAGICHGTAGIAMMFSYMYRETGDELFKDARNYWIDATLDMSRFPNGPAGYKKFSIDDDKQVKWEDSYSLLEGITGVGFMLLSLFDDQAEKDLLESFGLY